MGAKNPSLRRGVGGGFLWGAPFSQEFFRYLLLLWQNRLFTGVGAVAEVVAKTVEYRLPGGGLRSGCKKRSPVRRVLTRARCHRVV